MFAGHIIVGTAFTVTVAVILAPTQPSGDVGIMVKVTVCGTVVVLVSVPVISPVPLAAMPVTFTVLSLVHANVVPGTSLVSTIGVIGPEHTVCEAGVAVAVGVGITNPRTGVLGELTQTCPAEYSNSIREILVVGPNSLQISLGSVLDSGNCIPRRSN